MKKAYVTALVESILAGKPIESTLSDLKVFMQKRGHLRLWSQVLKAALRELEVKLRRVTPQLSVAEPTGVSEAVIQDALKALGVAVDASYATKIDTTLVGGFILRFQGRQLDKSYKRVLLDLYDHITK